MSVEIPSKNVQRSVTLNRFLYAALKEEADKSGLKVAHIINQELSKRFQEKIVQLKQEEQNKYSS